MSDDYYVILGIEKNSTEEQIKKGYKRAALKWHPDRNPNNQEEATEKFKKLSEAYDVLVDPNKRKIYDKYGKKGLEEGGRNGMSSHNIFQEMFGGIPGFFPGNNQNVRHSRPRKGENILFNISVTLEELYLGCKKKLKVNRNIICSGCKGSGCKNASQTANTHCSECQGQGVKIILRQLAPGFVSQQRTMCGACSGTGEFIYELDRCVQCKGEKVVKESIILELDIQKGMRNGTKIVFERKNDEYPGVVAGDIVVILRCKGSSSSGRLNRNGNDLFYKKEICLQEALCGFKFTITHLDGRNLLVINENDIIEPNSTRRILNEGMPMLNGEKGDFIIEFVVIFPSISDLTHKDKQELQKLLPPSSDTLYDDEKNINKTCHLLSSAKRY